MTTLKNTVDKVVTEWGDGGAPRTIAQRACSGADRHRPPDFREQLTKRGPTTWGISTAELPRVGPHRRRFCDAHIELGSTGAAQNHWLSGVPVLSGSRGDQRAGVGIIEQGEQLRRERVGGDVGQRRASSTRRSDALVAIHTFSSALRRGRCTRALGGLAPHVGQRALHRPDDVGDADRLGRAGQPVAALGAPTTPHDAGAAELRRGCSPDTWSGCPGPGRARTPFVGIESTVGRASGQLDRARTTA